MPIFSPFSITPKYDALQRSNMTIASRSHLSESIVSWGECMTSSTGMSSLALSATVLIISSTEIMPASLQFLLTSTLVVLFIFMSFAASLSCVPVGMTTGSGRRMWLIFDIFILPRLIISPQRTQSRATMIFAFFANWYENILTTNSY